MFPCERRRSTCGIHLVLHEIERPIRAALGSHGALVAISSLAGLAGKPLTRQVFRLPAHALVAGAVPLARIGSVISFRTPPRCLPRLLAALIVVAAAKMTSDIRFPRVEPCRNELMKIGIVIATNDPENVWNAFRYGVFARKQGDPVRVFLLGKGVECESLADGGHNVGEQLRAFVEAGGEVLACGTCLKARESEGSDLCPISTLEDLQDVIRESERLLTF